MLWTIAYTASYTATQTDVDVPILTDPTLTIDSGNHPLLPVPLWVAWSYAMGTTIQRVRISTPRLKPIARPLIRPVEQAANPSSRPQFMENFRHPIKLRAIEPVSVLLTNSSPTTSGEQDYVILTLSDLQFNVPQGDMYTLRLTLNTTYTQTANAWSPSGALTLDDTIEVGQYSIIGMEGWGTGGVCGRLIFPGPALAGMQSQVRPGVLQPTAQGSEHNRYMRYGRLGEYGRFNSYAPPQLDVLATGTTRQTELYWDVVLLQPQIPGVAMGGP